MERRRHSARTVELEAVLTGEMHVVTLNALALEIDDRVCTRRACM